MFGQAIQRRVQQAGLARSYICHASFTNIARHFCAISLLTEVREAWVLRVHQHHNPVSFQNDWEVEDCNSGLLLQNLAGWLFPSKVLLHLVSVWSLTLIQLLFRNGSGPKTWPMIDNRNILVHMYYLIILMHYCFCLLMNLSL